MAPQNFHHVDCCKRSFRKRYKIGSSLSQQVAGGLSVDQSGNPLTHFFCGIVAGFLASGITHPADVIKTRLEKPVR